ACFFPRGWLVALDESRNSFAEDVRWRKQANHKTILGAEIVEMAWMNEDVVCLQEGDGEVFIREFGGEAQDSVPPAIGVEQSEGSMLRDSRLQVGTIFAQAFQDLRPHRVALLEQNREGPLRGGIEGEIGIRDDLQALQRGVCERFGAGGDDPGDFHLRERGNLGEAAKRESQRLVIAGEGRARGRPKGIVKENFVHDQGKVTLAAEFVETMDFLGLKIRARRVVGMNEQNRACARSERTNHTVEIDE